MTTDTLENSPAPEGERFLRPVEPATDYARRDRWAVIVGISEYQYETWNLKYAHRDAEALYELIRKPSGGGYQQDHVEVLIDQQATTSNVTRALRSFLKKPASEDVVLIFLACHGSPDPDRPENVYLITHDTDPEDISGTAVPMREITESLRDNLQAERTIIIADTCHSGVIGGRGLRAADETGPVNRYLQSLSETQPGLALLTSARSNETSREDARWGGGHGVFTHYLLEGMQGAADRSPKNGIVTVEELFEYVREKVHEATDRKQHPYTGPGPVFDWPMAWSGGQSAQEHLQLGHHLFELGQLLDDPGRFLAAARQFEDALHFSRMDGVDLPEAHVGRAQSLLAAGRPQETTTALAALDESGTADKHPEVHLHLGLACSELGQPDKAAAALEAFARLAPEDERAPWAGEYATWLQKIQTGRRTALLIGINEYADPAIQDLRGCVNDARLMGELLREQFGFSEDNIVPLHNSEATRQRIMDELTRLANPETTTAWDTVIVHFSGHSMPGPYEAYLFGHDAFAGSEDALQRGQVQDTITARELHTLMNRIPTKHKTLILDTHPNTLFLRMAQEEAEYALMVASSNEVTGEQELERDGKKIVMGHFTWALLERLREVDPREVTYSQIIFPVMGLVQRYKPGQKPLFVGRRERRLFAEADDYATAFRFSMRRNYSAFTARGISSRYERVRHQLQGSFPAMHHSFGRAFLEHGRWSEAIEALGRCVEERGKLEPGLQLELATAQAGAQRYAEALANLKEYAAAVPDAAAEVEKVLPVIEGLQQGTKAGVLVGIDEYDSASVPSLQGAANDVAALKEVLLARHGFSEKDTVVLLNGEASRERILEEFERLVKTALVRPALFFFSGYGSVDSEDRPTLVSADGRRPGVYDIPLHRLAGLVAGKRANLTAVVDAGWSGSHETTPASRRLPADDPKRRPVERAILLPRSSAKSSIRIGCASLYNHSIQLSFRGGSFIQEQELEDPQDANVRRIYGTMTHSLVQSLWATESTETTCEQLIGRMEGKPYALGEALDQPVFSPVHGHPLVRELAGWAERDRVRQMIALLRRTIERRNDHDPKGHLNLGVAFGYLKEYDRAIEALNKALAQKSNYAGARYHLGRLLLESGRDPAAAVAELRLAAREDETNMAARYYLGQALRAFVEQDVLVEAERAFGEYLAGGAPLGQEEEVMAFLESRKAQR